MIIHQNATAETYNIFRNWILGIWLVVVLLSPVTSLAKLSVLSDYSIGFLLQYLPEAMKAGLFQPVSLAVLKGALVLGLGCMLVRRYSRTAGIVVCLLLTVYHGMTKGIGEVNHSELGMIYAVYLLVLFEWADSFYKPAEQEFQVSRYGLPLTAICATLCLAYTFIGLHRVVFGGIDLFLDNSIHYWIIENSNEPKVYPLGKLDHLLLEYDWLRFLVKAGFPIFTVLEIFALFALINKTYRFVFIAGMLCFHVFIWLFMGILFWENMLMYILFIEPVHRRQSGQHPG